MVALEGEKSACGVVWWNLKRLEILSFNAIHSSGAKSGVKCTKSNECALQHSNPGTYISLTPTQPAVILMVGKNSENSNTVTQTVISQWDLSDIIKYVQCIY